jgi:hypothetical protein
MPHAAPPIITQTTANESVPVGHRSKCRTCGAIDNIKLIGSRKLKRCGYCGSTLALRRAPRKPKVISYVVCKQLNGDNWGESNHPDQSAAEIDAIGFVENGPVGRVRVAQIVEMLDGVRTGNCRTLRYDNFREKRSSRQWTPGCESCKGRGLLRVLLRPAFGDVKAVFRLVPCDSCGALGGELTKKVLFNRRIR